MKTLNTKLFLDAIRRASEFHRKEHRSRPEIFLALTEVGDAIEYAIEHPKSWPTPKRKKRGKQR